MPDNFILLSQSDEYSADRITENLQNEEAVVKLDDINIARRLARNAVQENNIHMEGVKQVCKGFITELDGSKSEQ